MSRSAVRVLSVVMLAMLLTVQPVLAAPFKQERIPLAYGQTVTGSIDSIRFFQQYSFEGRTGDQVVITMEATSGDLDPLLLLGDSSLNLIAEDDDGGGGFNPRLEIVLPANGTYVVEATRYGQDTAMGRSAGEYRLSLVANQAEAAAGAPASGVLSALEFGKTKRGLLNASDGFHLFWFQGQAGDHVRIRAVDGPPGMALALYDSDFVELLRDLDGQDLQAVLERDGVYWVAVALGDSQAAGPYALVLSGSLSDPVSGAQQAMAVGYGDSIQGAISNDRPLERYAFAGQAGDQVLIRMQASGDTALDPFLYLYGPNGEIVGQDDDGGGAPDAELAVVLPEDGQYSIVATRFGRDSGETTGEYEISIASPNGIGGTVAVRDPVISLPEAFDDLPRLQYGDSVGGAIDDARYSQAYVFEASAGDQVTFSMENRGGDLDPMIMLMDSAFNVVGQHDDISDVNKNALLEWVIPEDGFYAVLAMRYNGEIGTTSGQFRLRLDAANARRFGRIATLLAAEPLSAGNASGQLGDNLASVYAIYATAGDDLSIDLEVNGPLQQESVLVLADANLRELAVSLEGTLRHTVEQDGKYLLIVTRQGGPLGTARGFYTLAVSGANPQAAEILGIDSAPVYQPGDVLPYDTLVFGTISDTEPEVRYRFAGRRGDRVTLRLDAVDATLDPSVRVLGPDGSIVAQDDNGGGNLNALIPAFLLTEDGEYTIVLTRTGGNNGTSRGRFEFMLGGLAVTVPTTSPGQDGATPETAYPLEVGQTVAGSITDERSATFYALRLQAGQVLQVTMVSSAGDLDSLLVVLDATLNLVGTDDDSAGRQNARLLFSVPADGVYYLGATRFDFMNGQTTGEYLLSVISR